MAEKKSGSYKTAGRDRIVIREARCGEVVRDPLTGSLKPGAVAPRSGQHQEIAPRRAAKTVSRSAHRDRNPLAKIAGTYQGEEWDALQKEIQRQRQEG